MTHEGLQASAALESRTHGNLRKPEGVAGLRASPNAPQFDGTHFILMTDTCKDAFTGVSSQKIKLLCLEART